MPHKLYLSSSFVNTWVNVKRTEQPRRAIASNCWLQGTQKAFGWPMDSPQQKKSFPINVKFIMTRRSGASSLVFFATYPKWQVLTRSLNDCATKTTFTDRVTYPEWLMLWPPRSRQSWPSRLSPVRLSILRQLHGSSAHNHYTIIEELSAIHSTWCTSRIRLTLQVVYTLRSPCDERSGTADQMSKAGWMTRNIFCSSAYKRHCNSRRWGHHANMARRHKVDCREIVRL